MTVDAHLHLWDLDRVDYPWLTDALAPINRTFGFAEVRPQLERAGVDRIVLVQAADSAADSAAMFAVADASRAAAGAASSGSPRVVGVVAWVDLLDPRAAARRLDEWADRPDLVGIRHLIHDEPDADWLGRPPVRESLALLADRGISFDVIGVLPRHLEHALELADTLPSLRLVIDHLGTPPVGGSPDAVAVWSGLITELARRPNVFVKLSGLTTLDGGADAARLRPFADHALGAFGTTRTLYGGDWPVSTLAGDYAATWTTANDLLTGLSADERDDVLTRSAERAYRLPPL